MTIFRKVFQFITFTRGRQSLTAISPVRAHLPVGLEICYRAGAAGVCADCKFGRRYRFQGVPSPIGA